MKKLIIMLLAVGYVFSMTSCASSESCWAYRDVGSQKFNNNKHRPSVAGAMNKKRAKIRY
jgi:hypothetical protein